MPRIEKTMPEMKRAGKNTYAYQISYRFLEKLKSYSRLFLIFIRVGSVAAPFKSAFLIAEKFQETHDSKELQSAVTFVLVKVSSKFKLFCAAFVELYQINF